MSEQEGECNYIYLNKIAGEEEEEEEELQSYIVEEQEYSYISGNAKGGDLYTADGDISISLQQPILKQKNDLTGKKSLNVNETPLKTFKSNTQTP